MSFWILPDSSSNHVHCKIVAALSEIIISVQWKVGDMPSNDPIQGQSIAFFWEVANRPTNCTIHWDMLLIRLKDGKELFNEENFFLHAYCVQIQALWGLQNMTWPWLAASPNYTASSSAKGLLNITYTVKQYSTLFECSLNTHYLKFLFYLTQWPLQWQISPDTWMSRSRPLPVHTDYFGCLVIIQEETSSSSGQVFHQSSQAVTLSNTSVSCLSQPLAWLMGL